VSDHRYQIEVSSHTVIHTLLCRSTSLIPEDASNIPIAIASGLLSQFAGLSPTQTSVVTLDRSLTSRIWETPSTDSPQLWALATSQLFNQLDRYLRPKSLQKMRREERTDLVNILYLVFMGVCSTPPPTGKIAQESLDSLKQALLAYMHYITPNIPLSGSQFNFVIPMAISLYGNSVLLSMFVDLNRIPLPPSYYCLTT